MVESVAELRKILRKDEEERLFEEVVIGFFSLYLTKFFLGIKGITPSQVTVLGMIIGVMSALFFATGDYYFGVFGALLMFLWYVLDNVDGEIARYQKSYSIQGHNLDALNGNLISLMILFGISFGTFIKNQSLLLLGLGLLMCMSFSFYSLMANIRSVSYLHLKAHKVLQNNLKISTAKDIAGKHSVKVKSSLMNRFLFKLGFLLPIFQLSIRFLIILVLAIIGRFEYLIYFFGVITPFFLIANIYYQYNGGLITFFKGMDEYIKSRKLYSYKNKYD
jgi:phosphatidylglycerophosphate synthase